MKELLIPLLVGGSVSLLGGGLLWMHVRKWREQRADEELAEGERTHLRARYRRRMQASGLLVLLGLLLMLSTEKIPWRQAPLLFTIYVGVLLLLTAWIVTLAIADAVSSRFHTQAELSRIRREQRALEESLSRLRRKESNGKDQ